MPDLSRQVADRGAEGTGGGSYLLQRPESLWCQGIQLQKPEMCVRETETAAEPSAQTQGCCVRVDCRGVLTCTGSVCSALAARISEREAWERHFTQKWTLLPRCCSNVHGW